MLKKAAYAVTIFAGLINPVAAAEISDGEITAREVMKGTYLTFEVKNWPEGARGVMLRIEGPKEYSLEQGFGKSVPALDLARYGSLPGGLYDYEIRGGTSKAVERTEKFDNGRGKNDVQVDFTAFVLSGQFRVTGGELKEFSQPAETKSEKPVIEDEKSPDTDSGKPSDPKGGEPGPGDDAKDSDG